MRNPLVVPTILHIIIPCVLLFIKAYNANLLWFSLTLSMVRIIITFTKLCENIGYIKFSNFIFIIELLVIICGVFYTNLGSFEVYLIYGMISQCYDTRYYFKSIKTNKSLNTLNIVSNYNFGGEECCICYEGLKIEQNIVRLNCRHIYHKTCIEEWFKEKRVCPYYCRSSADDCLPEFDETNPTGEWRNIIA